MTKNSIKKENKRIRFTDTQRKKILHKKKYKKNKQKKKQGNDAHIHKEIKYCIKKYKIKNKKTRVMHTYTKK